MKYAQIVDGTVHGVFEYGSLPEFAPNIVMVELAGVVPEPKPGWEYDGENFIEPPAPEPVPAGLSQMQFIEHIVESGGMTAQQENEIVDDPNLRMFWKKLEVHKGNFEKTDARVVAGIHALDQLGYLPNGKQAVLDAWPTN